LIEEIVRTGWDCDILRMGYIIVGASIEDQIFVSIPPTSI
jgi:hypothetical protein